MLDAAVDEHRFRQAVPVLHRFQAVRRSRQHVRLGHAELCVVHRGIETLAARLVQRGPQDVCRCRDELHARRARALDGANALACLLGRVDRSRFLGSEERIHVNARPGDLVGIEEALDLHFLLERPVVADRAPGGHAVGEPELQHVFRRHVLPRVLVMDVQVRVDEAGQHVHAREVELAAAVERRTIVRIDRQQRGTDAANGRDAIVLDDDVDGAARRGAGAVDQVHAAQDQAFERTVTLRAPRNLVRALRTGGERQQCRKNQGCRCRNERARTRYPASFAHRAPPSSSFAERVL